ncbi:LysR family transcriptional regulator [Paraburkholderia acidisoli]|nr:LysR family transcriptional regulator [Paraburkholderia acidisoli]
MDINGCLAFVAVVEEGSFAAAGRALDLPRSTVSARVAALEARLGVRLLRRTTRSVALTADGEAWYASVAEAIRTLREAERTGIARGSALAGSIRLSVPLDFPADVLGEAIARFVAAHPLVNIDVHAGNEVVDFVAGNVDLAVRGRQPGGNDAVARRIASFRFAAFASAKWLEAHSAPHAEPALAFSTGFADGARTAKARVRANTFALLKALALRGAGVAVLPAHVGAPHVERGELVEVALPDGVEPQADLYLVYPSRRDMSARVRAFADALCAALAAP